MRRALRVAGGIVALAAPVTGLLVARRSEAVTSYASLGTLELVAGLIAAGALGVVALLLLAGPDRRGVAWGAAAVAVAFSAPEWAGWENGSPLVRSVAELLGPGALLLAVGAVVAGRRWFVPALVLIGPLTLVRAAVRDPFTAADCWRNCSDNVLAVAPDVEAAAAIRVLLNLAVALAATSLVLFAAHRLMGSARAPGLSERLTWTAAIPFALVVCARQVLLVIEPTDGPERAGMRELWLALTATMVLFAAALATRPLAMHRRRRRIRALARELASAPGEAGLAARLARDLGDPSLRVSFPDGRDGWLDEHGRPAASPSEAPRAVARIERSGRLVATVEYEPAVLDPSTLAEQLAPAARMALENGGLRARLVAQVEELTAVRRRIVDDGDAARKALERALHDGAQQALVSLLIDLRLAAEEDPRAARAAAEVQQALGELREIAHGIFPTVLAEDGIAAAVDVLLDEAEMPVDDELEDVRLPPPVEVAAYRLFAQALAVPAEAATLRLATDSGGVVAEAVLTRANGRTVVLEEVEDRFAALQGAVEVQRLDGQLRVRGWVPAHPAPTTGEGCTR